MTNHNNSANISLIMARQKVDPRDKRKIKHISASDNEWQAFLEAANKDKRSASEILRAMMESFVQGHYYPFNRPK